MESRPAIIQGVAASLLAIGGLVLAAPQTSQKAPQKKTTARKAAPARTTTAKKASARRRTTARAIPRKAALVQVNTALQAGEALNGTFEPFDNPGALVPFFERLYRLKHEDGPAVHVLHYGDSHTASDDMPAALRQGFQAVFGDGGPGYATPGKYRRDRVVTLASRGWKFEGTARTRGDGMHGLGGLSMIANRFGETVTLRGDGEQAELYFLQQPGGGNLDIWLDDAYRGTVSTDGERKAVAMTLPGDPGPRRYLFRTATAGPVRLLGAMFQNSRGVTWETLGINGASASMLAGWDEDLLSAHVAARDPAMVVLAYGTNESNTRRWDPAAYEDTLSGVVARIRRVAPAASILVVGPPDCRVRSPRLLGQIVEVQRRVALQFRCAFWDWRARMGGEGSIRSWYYAGLAQRDLIHFNRTGYQLLGQALYGDLMLVYGRFLTVRSEAVNVAAREDR